MLLKHATEKCTSAWPMELHISKTELGDMPSEVYKINLNSKWQMLKSFLWINTQQSLLMFLNAPWSDVSWWAIYRQPFLVSLGIYPCFSGNVNTLVCNVQTQSIIQEVLEPQKLCQFIHHFPLALRMLFFAAIIFPLVGGLLVPWDRRTPSFSTPSSITSSNCFWTPRTDSLSQKISSNRKLRKNKEVV